MITGMVIQFICRGNAFRSIIAEAYLNSLAIPNLTILSSGTVAGAHKVENSPNFPKTLALLKRHGIEQFAKDHYADDIEQGLLDKSDIIIFLNNIAYQEATLSFMLPENVRVWDVIDLGEEGRIPTNETERLAFMDNVFNEIVTNVDSLVSSGELKTQ